MDTRFRGYDAILLVTPAKAGVHACSVREARTWIPAFAGMTSGKARLTRAVAVRANDAVWLVTPAKAGVHACSVREASTWIPAFAGMTRW